MIAERYELLEPLGQGGMAEVHLARQRGVSGFEKLVVVKRALAHLSKSETFQQMMLDEARIAGELRHPNIVSVFDVGIDDEGCTYIVMEFIEGQALAQVMRHQFKRRERMPLPIACKIAVDCAAALFHAHEAADSRGQPLHIIHRDVSPQNVILSNDGVVKLVDFGIAKAANRLSEETRTGGIKGKAPYMSPEQLAGGDVDARTDLFALCVVLYEMTTGSRLFARKTMTQTVLAVERCEVPRPSVVVEGYPLELEEILLRGLAKDREDRFDSGDTLAGALERFTANAGAHASQRELAKYVSRLSVAIANEGEVPVARRALAATAKVERELVSTAATASDLPPSDGLAATAIVVERSTVDDTYSNAPTQRRPPSAGGIAPTAAIAAPPPPATMAATETVTPAPRGLAVDDTDTISQESPAAERDSFRRPVAAAVIGALALGGAVAATMSQSASTSASRPPALGQREIQTAEASDLAVSTSDVAAEHIDDDDTQAPKNATASAKAGDSKPPLIATSTKAVAKTRPRGSQGAKSGRKQSKPKREVASKERLSTDAVPRMPAAAPKLGYVTFPFDLDPYFEVLVDGRFVGKTPIYDPIAVPEGEVKVTFRNPITNNATTKVVVVEAGQTKKLRGRAK